MVGVTVSHLPPMARSVEAALRRELPAAGEHDLRRLTAAVCDAASAHGSSVAPTAARVRTAYGRRDRDAKMRALSGALGESALAERFGLSARQVRRILDDG